MPSKRQFTLFTTTLIQRLEAIKLLSGEHKISVLCRVLNVNRSSYYKYINRKESNRDKENKLIRSCILEIYAKSNKRLGADKIKTCLKRDYRINISTGRVYRLMKQMQPPKMSTIKPKFKASKKSDDKPCPNILKQKFNPKEPNTAWCTNITYIKIGGRFCYLCVIIDLFSRRIIAYKISKKLIQSLF